MDDGYLYKYCDGIHLDIECLMCHDGQYCHLNGCPNSYFPPWTDIMILLLSMMFAGVIKWRMLNKRQSIYVKQIIDMLGQK